jgi:hypothetical protein
MAKKLKAFQVAVGNQGQELRIDVQFADGTKEQIEFGTELTSRLVQSLIQGAATAERMRAQPGSTVSTNMPWRVRDIRTGTVLGADLFAVGFMTEEGPPVEIAMPRSIAEKMIRALLDDLKKESKEKK